jgi:hypothetical protein
VTLNRKLLLAFFGSLGIFFIAWLPIWLPETSEQTVNLTLRGGDVALAGVQVKLLVPGVAIANCELLPAQIAGAAGPERTNANGSYQWHRRIQLSTGRPAQGLSARNDPLLLCALLGQVWRPIWQQRSGLGAHRQLEIQCELPSHNLAKCSARYDQSVAEFLNTYVSPILIVLFVVRWLISGFANRAFDGPWGFVVGGWITYPIAIRFHQHEVLSLVLAVGICASMLYAHARFRGLSDKSTGPSRRTA